MAKESRAHGKHRKREEKGGLACGKKAHDRLEDKEGASKEEVKFPSDSVTHCYQCLEMVTGWLEYKMSCNGSVLKPQALPLFQKRVPDRSGAASLE